ncbi:MAG: hypothetical protein JW774_03140 [Candidatus Aureabacteria bacterium]|nr:hypothetical protein [Candidatus Auribacterota bacterium]
MEPFVLTILGEVCHRYFKEMFGIDVDFDKNSPPLMSERPPFKTEVYVYIGLAGENHQGQLVLGFSKNFVSSSVSKYTQRIKPKAASEFEKSAMCELLNNIAGLVCNHKQFNDKYSEVSQTLPVFNDTTVEGPVYFTRSEGGQVSFRHGKEEIFAYISLKKFVSIQIKPEKDDDLLDLSDLDKS